MFRDPSEGHEQVNSAVTRVAYTIREWLLFLHLRGRCVPEKKIANRELIFCKF
jgi:hypothetical protein